MKWSSSTGIFFVLLVAIFFVEQIKAQRPIQFPGSSDTRQNCPSDTRCMELSRCPDRILSAMTEDPVPCGYTYNWRRRICCPRRMSTANQPRPAPPAPEPVPVPDTPRPRPEVPAPSPERPRIRPVSAPIPGPPVPVPEPNNQECGALNRLQGFVVGGDLAQPGAWPWLASIAMRGRSGIFSGWCTGSMITRSHVVSAAHCYENRDPSLYVARVGNVNQSMAEEYTISQITIPETYVRGRFYDDIAILTLSRPVESEGFSPICLPPRRNFVNLTGEGTVVAGWGSTEPGGPLSDSLRQLTGLPVMSNERCDTALTARVTGFRGQFNRGISEGLLCAAFMEGGKDTCAGDSGGPMMYLHDDDRWYLVGVVSFGISCAEPGFPAGYTRITEYLDWIRSVTRG